MYDNLNVVWIATHPLLGQAQFVRQDNVSILLKHPAKALVNAWRFQLYLSDADRSDVQHGHELPDKYNDVQLYHVRAERFLNEDALLGDQGVAEGDVFVIVNGDSETRSLLTAMIQQTQAFPIFIPSDILPPHKHSLSADDLSRISAERKSTPGSSGSVQNIMFIGEVSHMGDNYTAQQAGAMGPHARAHDMTFNQAWSQIGNSIVLKDLASELSKLRQEMKKDAIDPEQDIAVSEVAKAEQAATSGDGSKTLQHLRSAGKWAFDVATKIGTGLAIEALKAASGLK